MRAVVRRAGTAPVLPGVREHVGDFADGAFAAAVLTVRSAAVTTVHPMGERPAGPAPHRRRGDADLRAGGRAGGVERLVHVSTAAVYDRSPGPGTSTSRSALVGDDAGTTPSPSATPTWRWPRSTGSPGCCCGRRRSSVPGEPRSGTPCGRGRSATTRRHGTRCPSRPSPGCTSTTWSRSPPTSPPVGSADVGGPADRTGRGRVHRRQRREPARDDARLRRRRWPGRRGRAGLGRRRGLDRAMLADRARGWGWEPRGAGRGSRRARPRPLEGHGGDDGRVRGLGRGPHLVVRCGPAPGAARGRTARGSRAPRPARGRPRRRPRGEEHPDHAAALEVGDVVHTARRARASIGERLDDHLALLGDLVPQVDGRRPGEGRLAVAPDLHPVGLEQLGEPVERRRRRAAC